MCCCVNRKTKLRSKPIILCVLQNLANVVPVFMKKKTVYCSSIENFNKVTQFN